ncbi:MAG: hypothetical protein V2I56_05850 [Desulfobacteraceae bacterium]|jgi:hypothetical protein|nr:hypothetical protein [Desulfobacteraceae bacterium]
MVEGGFQTNETHFSWWMPTYVTLLIMGIFILVTFNINRATAQSMLQDDGLVQILTAVALITGCLFCLQRALRKIPPAFKWGQLSYLLMIYAMREMDFHRLFTAEHVSRWKLYAGPFPLQDKVIGGVVVLLTLAVMLYFIGSNFRHFWQSLKARQSWAVHVIIWAVLLFSSQMLDKSRWHGIFAEVTLEENMEFGAAIMIFMVLLKYPLNFSQRPTESQ